MIEEDFTAVMLRPIQGQQIGVTLTYDPDVDPYAVIATFRVQGDPEVRWTFGRELLLRGCTSSAPYGDGDVRFRLLGPGSEHLLMCLASPEGHADLRLPQVRVVGFLNRTCDLIPFGGEPVGERIDEFLKEVFES